MNFWLSKFQFMKMKKHALLFALLLGTCLQVAAQTPKDTLNLRDKHFMRQAAYEANQDQHLHMSALWACVGASNRTGP